MSNEEELRKQAVKRIGVRRAFYTNLAIYVIVNIALVGFWYVSGAGYFWPGWVIFGWGIGVAVHGFKALGKAYGPSEVEVQREMDKMRGQS